MVEWQVGDVAVAIKDAQCGCHRDSIKQRGTYRVRRVECPQTGWLAGNVFLDVSSGDEHFYPHEYFRREQPASTDVFKLAARPKAPVLEPSD